ncbi:GNAT family N-acetyltransferase [Chitinophaga ginsengisoli]|uniref:Phosphinothricin acetyltransferase n=1 Tax=Chitinophaga ginsengisoli TaxID=363837 RepID=A0A2P8G4L5_9BACT|nr:GNAT family N-acetyltransferase [Chitinophaga ginsengisoli]PSL28914.1 phosphinothricin acetyltransferase [Chitinophaga ginsengisoli]
MTYRNATLQDLPAIVAIYNTTIAGRMVTADTEPVTVESRIHWFNVHSPEKRPLWMVEDNGVTVGWASFQSFYGRPAYDGTCEISIYLHEDQRGKGYGKTILRYAMEQCPSIGVHTLLGFIFAHNLPSLRLFEQLGFTEWAHLPNIAVLDGVERSLNILGKRIY